jgi:hypothetical protein
VFSRRLQFFNRAQAATHADPTGDHTTPAPVIDWLDKGGMRALTVTRAGE